MKVFCSNTHELAPLTSQLRGLKFKWTVAIISPPDRLPVYHRCPFNKAVNIFKGQFKWIRAGWETWTQYLSLQHRDFSRETDSFAFCECKTTMNKNKNLKFNGRQNCGTKRLVIPKYKDICDIFCFFFFWRSLHKIKCKKQSHK